ncbi:hypothetical protein JCM17960_23720 [Magnetospira thiophila]
MNYKRSALYGVALAVVFAIAGASSAKAEDMARAELLAANCYNCHGPKGESLGIIPGLSDIKASRMIGYMSDYKGDNKVAPIMNRIAKGYSDKEIEAIANYFEKINK